MIKLTNVFFWRLSFYMLLALCVGLAGAIWFLGKRETGTAMTGGQRLIVAIETGLIEGTQAPSEDAAKKAAETQKLADTPVAEKAPEPVATPTADKIKDTPAPEEKVATKPATKDIAADTKPKAEAVATDTKPAVSSKVVPDFSASAEALKKAKVPLMPVKETLTEKSSDGFLPIVSADGAKPWHYYSKPYAHKSQLPVIAIVVTGLGQNKNATDMAIKLPENFSLSFSPYSKEFGIWLNAARIAGHEALVDLPVEPNNFPASDPGPYGLLVGKGVQINLSRLAWLMSRGQGYIGFITPQNDVFSSSTEEFKAVLGDLEHRGVALVMGHEPANAETTDLLNKTKAAHAVADVLVDEELSTTAIQARLLSLEKLAAKRGYAVGVAQAFPLSVQQLTAWSEQLEKDGYELAPISYVIGLKYQD